AGIRSSRRLRSNSLSRSRRLLLLIHAPSHPRKQSQYPTAHATAVHPSAASFPAPRLPGASHHLCTPRPIPASTLPFPRTSSVHPLRPGPPSHPTSEPSPHYASSPDAPPPQLPASPSPAASSPPHYCAPASAIPHDGLSYSCSYHHDIILNFQR